MSDDSQKNITPRTDAPPAKVLRLAVQLIELAAARYADDGCTDYSFPAEWTEEEIQAATFEHDQETNDGRGYDPSLPLRDNWIVMYWCARKLYRMAESGDPIIERLDRIEAAILDVQRLSLRRPSDAANRLTG